MAADDMGRLVGPVERTASALGRVAALIEGPAAELSQTVVRRAALIACGSAPQDAAGILIDPEFRRAGDAGLFLDAAQIARESSNGESHVLADAIEAAGLGACFPDATRARVHAALRSHPDDIGPLSAIVTAGIVGGCIIAPSPSLRIAERAVALSSTVVLARAGLAPQGCVGVLRLDAAARSAAVQLERSGVWGDWLAVWCALLEREAVALQRALAGALHRLATEISTVRGQPRVGATDADVLAWLHRYSTFTIKEASAALGMTTPTIGASIERLEAAGFAAELTGRRRDRIWTSAALLELATAR